jgi:hypothetical protein
MKHLKKIKKIKKEHIWLSCMAIGPITAYAAVFNPSLSIIAIIFTIVGIKGILVHVM